MITYVRGSLFASPAPVLVNTVNLVGVMGKGIAKDFRFYFPEMFREYQELCEGHELKIGTLHFWRGPGKSVLNFPTKCHWRAKARLEDIREGLNAFVANYDHFSIRSIAFPQLGCGNGDLNWENEVRPLMEAMLGLLPIEIYVHIYDGGAEFIEHHHPNEMRVWLRSEPTSLPFSEVWSDIVEGIVNANGMASDHSWIIKVCDADDERGIEFTSNDQRVAEFVSENELMSIWSQLRSFGFVGILELPSAVAQPLGDLLQSLPYVEPVRFTRMADLRETDNLFGDGSVGYRLSSVSSTRTIRPPVTQKSLI